MSRIGKVFETPGRTAFIGFTVAGDPDEATSLRIAEALIAGGTDILELGIPFSDPVADGPTIQRADDRAFAAGTTPDTVFRIVRKIRAESEIPIVFLTYYNIVYRRGIEQFYSEAREAGVDGILIADMPVEESGEVTASVRLFGSAGTSEGEITLVKLGGHWLVTDLQIAMDDLKVAREKPKERFFPSSYRWMLEE